MGFEPTTLSLARRCSTTEPLPHNSDPPADNKGAEGQTRTVDTGIFSAVLYHLSYLGWTKEILNLVFQSCQAGNEPSSMLDW